MGLSEWSPEELLHMLKKRQIDLRVMGIDIVRNRPKIDVKTRESKTWPTLTRAIDSRIADLVEIAGELTSRNIPIKIDLTKQHPFIRKRLEEAIQKAGLIKRPTLPGITAKRIAKKIPRPKRRL